MEQEISEERVSAKKRAKWLRKARRDRINHLRLERGLPLLEEDEMKAKDKASDRAARLARLFKAKNYLTPKYVDAKPKRTTRRHRHRRPTVTTYFDSRGRGSGEFWGHAAYNPHSHTAHTHSRVIALANHGTKSTPRLVPRSVVRRHTIGRKGRSAKAPKAPKSRAAKRRAAAAKIARRASKGKAKRVARRSSSKHPIIRKIEDASNALSVGSVPSLDITRSELATLPKADATRMLNEYRAMTGKLDKIYARKVNAIKKSRKPYAKARKIAALARELTDVRQQIRAIKKSGVKKVASRFAEEHEQDESEEVESDQSEETAEEEESLEEAEDSNLSAKVASELEESEESESVESESESESRFAEESESESESTETEEDAAARENAKRELLDLATSELHSEDEGSFLQRMKEQINA